MRFYKYLNEEDIVQKALSMDEPKTGKKYNKEDIEKKLDLLNKAIELQSNIYDNDQDNESLEAILNDLLDKKDKWSNWKEEVKTKGPNVPLELQMTDNQEEE
jgi:hypothetical protein